MANKTYYYLKLEQDYFNNKIVKALRKMPGGADLCVCYLKMQLRYLHTEGYIQFNGICNTMSEEIAMDIDEDSKVVELTLTALKKWNCVEELSADTLYMVECQHRIGSITDVAKRVAKHRAKNKELTTCQKNDKVLTTTDSSTEPNLLQCNTNVTKCNDILEKELDIEIEKDIEIDKELDIDKEKEKENIISNFKRMCKE